MPSFLAWYILITLLGWITFPLTHRLFPALADRGYSFTRAFGLLIWGYAFWLSASLGFAQNDIGGLLLGWVILGGLSAWAYFVPHASRPTQLIEWLKENKSLILSIEILFLVAFALMAFIRAANPEIVGTEKPMELMFINGIMNSPGFPPRDLWLSGYSISYYYFGYVMTSMLAMFTGAPATMAFNLMIALVFGLGAIGAYGILYNLLAHYPLPVTNLRSKIENRKSLIASPLLAPLFLLLVSNVEGFLEVLHRKGLFWREGTNFWTWLDMKELSQAPSLPLGWMPDRYLWWWRASRVVQDYDLNDTFFEAIDEFPFFSFLLGDLHPHVLAIPFLLLGVGVALNLFLGGWRGRIDLFFGQLRIDKAGFFVIALVLGGLAFLNTWDILIAAGLIVFSYALRRVREAGWDWERIEDVLLLGIPAAITAVVMYLPFYIGFDSQAGGVVPNFMFPTRGAHTWVMWGTLFVPLFAYLIHSSWTGTPAHWLKGILITLGILLTLVAAMFAIGFVASKFKPEIVEAILQSQGRDLNAFIADSMRRRLSYVGGLITLTALLIPSFAFLFGSAGKSSDISQDTPQTNGDERSNGMNSRSSMGFVLLLVTLGTLLILGPDFLYLRDQFGYRINSVFKFYYEAWILLSLASAFGTAVLLHNLRSAARIIFGFLLALVLIVSLMYPTLGILTKTNNFKPLFGYTLDDFERVQRENPDEAAAMLWLRSAPDGVVAEAIGGQYSQFARISIYTGLPTVLGWPGHEGQWRDNALQGSRQHDIEILYSTPNWVVADQILRRYDIRYVVVGGLERTAYRLNEAKFNSFMKRVFQQGSLTIYEVP